MNTYGAPHFIQSIQIKGLLLLSILFMVTIPSQSQTPHSAKPLELFGYENTIQWHISGNHILAKVKKSSPRGCSVGTTIFEGRLFGDQWMGDMNLCFIHTQLCAQSSIVPVVLVLSQQRNKIRGLIHIQEKTCKELFKSQAITFHNNALLKKKQKPQTTLPIISEQIIEDKLALALTAMGSGKPNALDEAQKTFEEILHARPEHPNALNGLGIISFIRKNYQKAVDYYIHAITADPTFADAYYNLACVDVALGQPEMALAHLRLALLNGFVDFEAMAIDADLSPLHQLPAFKALQQGKI